MITYSLDLQDLLYRVFSLMWPAWMQIYWNKRKRLNKKGVQLPQDWFGTPTWPPFHCFGTPIWPSWPDVKSLYCAKVQQRNLKKLSCISAVAVAVLYTQSLKKEFNQNSRMAATIKNDNDNAQAYVIPRNFTSAGTFSKFFHVFLYLELWRFFLSQ